tara:strand:+ start:713 stop:898 length:186 start_codon:yes stop_codon:yes gene_type:complete
MYIDLSEGISVGEVHAYVGADDVDGLEDFVIAVIDEANAPDVDAKAVAVEILRMLADLLEQ